MDATELKARLGNGSPGTYILCLQLKHSQDITIGKLGTFNFQNGFIITSTAHLALAVLQYVASIIFTYHRSQDGISITCANIVH